MAKSKGKNTSQSIRDYLAANPEAKAKEVVEALGKSGVKTNEGLVYAVKGSMKEKKRRKRRVAKAAMAAAPSSNGKVKQSLDANHVRFRSQEGLLAEERCDARES